MLRRIVVMLVLVCLLPVHALASQDAPAFRCKLHLSVNAKGIVTEPFDRWFSELADALVPEVEYLAWPEGEALYVDLFAMGVRMFDMGLVRVGERIALHCSLMGEGQVLLTGDQAKDALTLLEQVAALLAPDTDWPNADCTLTMHAGRIRTQLHWNAVVLNRWADGADGHPRETAQAMAAFMEGLADITEVKEDNAPILSVFVDYEASNARPGEIRDDARAAPEELLCVLAVQLPEAIVRTIAEVSRANADARKAP